MIWKGLITLLFFVSVFSGFIEAAMKKEAVTNMPCFPEQFRCENGNCIKNSYRCDGDYSDCGGTPQVNMDHSDEYDCGTELWNLNRFERFQRLNHRAAKWIVGQIALKPNQRAWGYSPERVSVALYMINETFFSYGNITGDTVSSDLQNYVLSKLAQQSADEIDLTELASFINALIAACVEPREFYGVDLVAKLRARVDNTEEVGPLPFIALCNAGVYLEASDIQKLAKIYNSNSRDSWAGMQAMAVMGMACTKTQTSWHYNTYASIIKNAVNKTTGLVEDFKATAIVLQALIAGSGDVINTTRDFIPYKLFWRISELQEENGSFGDMLKTYYFLPMFSWKSFLDINDAHCTEQARNGRIIQAWIGEKRQIQYSFWLGTSIYFNATINFRASVKERFYSMMKVAVFVNERFKFEVSIRDNKPYVYSIYGIEDDPEGGNLWYLYKVRDDGTTQLINESPIDYMPANGDHMVYWFREVPSY